MEEHKKSILVVDDEKDLTDAVANALEHEGYATHVANGGVEGLRIALEEHPDLIFLDIEMPDLEGTEVLKKIRADKWGETVPVIVMTVVEDTEKIAEVVENRGDAYVLKNNLNLFEMVDLAKRRLS